MLFKYSSNNSGGRWWLTDEDWQNLEKNGWKVEWHADDENGLMRQNGRFLGALASYASKEFGSLKEAISDFSNITGACFYDAGCSCCGAPHNFSWRDEDGNYGYASGDDYVDDYYDDDY